MEIGIDDFELEQLKKCQLISKEDFEKYKLKTDERVVNVSDYERYKLTQTLKELARTTKGTKKKMKINLDERIPSLDVIMSYYDNGNDFNSVENECVYAYNSTDDFDNLSKWYYGKVIEFRHDPA